MNLQLLRSRLQGNDESFTDYYNSIIDLCHKYDTTMTDLQMVDWLKVGMKIALCEKLQGEDFLTPQDLLHRTQPVELDNAVLDARKRQLPAFPITSPSHSNIPKKIINQTITNIIQLHIHHP